MDFDFEPYFKKYEALAALADQVFAKVDAMYPGCVQCKKGCEECCHALFDLTLIEALYIGDRFRRQYPDNTAEAGLERANVADRQIYRIKRQAGKLAAAGVGDREILETMARERVRCPLLNDHQTCDLYPYRPITCRLYGIPTAIGGKGHTCGLSFFKEGEPYSTVNLDEIQSRLFDLSEALIRDMEARFDHLAGALMPLSTALLSEFDDRYFGFVDADGEGSENG